MKIKLYQIQGHDLGKNLSIVLDLFFQFVICSLLLLLLEGGFGVKRHVHQYFSHMWLSVLLVEVDKM
jgi:hypothetical protein